MNSYVFELSDVSIASGDNTLYINNSDSVFGAIPGSMLWIDSYRPRFVQSVDNTARTVTLTATWDGTDVVNKPATIAPFPSLIDQQNALNAVNSVNSTAQGLLNRFLGLEATYQSYLEQRFYLLASLMSSALQFKTLANLYTYGEPMSNGYANNDVLAFVWGDSLKNNNGMFIWENGTWRKSIFNPASQSDVAEIGIEPQSELISGLTFAVADSEGKRTWVEIDLEGKPTDLTISLLKSVGGFLNGTEVEGIAAFATGIEDLDHDITGLCFAITDQAGKRTWLECDLSGNPTELAISAIKTVGEFASIEDVLSAINNAGIEDNNSELSGLSFAIIDNEDRRTWLEADLSGKPTQNSIDLIKDVSGFSDKDDIEKIVAEQSGITDFNDELSDVVFSIVDTNDRRTWLEAGKDGGPTEHAKTHILNTVGALDVYHSGPDFVCWGDSMTAGAGSNGNPYTQTLQTLISAFGSSGSVKNHGVGGESTVTITGRTNANPIMVDVENGVIPTVGRVNLTLKPINGYTPEPLKQGPSIYPVTLAGISGVFSRDIVNSTYQYWFERDEEGSSALVPESLPLYFSQGEAAREDIAIIWMGENGPSHERTLSDIKAIINHLSPPSKRFLILSRPGGNYEQDSEDASFFAEFGRRFIPIRQFLVEYGLSRAGLNPTTEDLSNIAERRVPDSLRSDAIHFTQTGYEIVGNVIFERLTELNWITNNG